MSEHICDLGAGLVLQGNVSPERPCQICGDTGEHTKAERVRGGVIGPVVVADPGCVRSDDCD